jgi:hypothetical protein
MAGGLVARIEIKCRIISSEDAVFVCPAIECETAQLHCASNGNAIRQGENHEPAARRKIRFANECGFTKIKQSDQL